MRKLQETRREVLLKGAAWLLLLVALPLLAESSNKWRLHVDGKSKVAGEIELALTPDGGTATNIVIAVPERTSENRVALLIRDALRSQFGTDVYHIETDDGEDVLVKAHGSTPHFDLVVIRNTADGLHVGLHRE